MRPLHIPIRGEWVPARLCCQQCGQEVRVNARARTPAGFAAVVRYRCPDNHVGVQRVKLDNTNRQYIVRRELDGLRVIPTEVGEDTIFRFGYEVKTPDESPEGAVIDQ